MKLSFFTVLANIFWPFSVMRGRTTLTEINGDFGANMPLMNPETMLKIWKEAQEEEARKKTEPTIDDMLELLQDVVTLENCDTVHAIRAILEQHRDTQKAIREDAEQVKRRIEIEAISAFITRVGAKYTVEHPTVVVPEFMQPWWDALEELEKETNERIPDEPDAH